jgi:hypothetical protein
MDKYIKSIGIELEGGMASGDGYYRLRNKLQGEYKEHFNYSRDSSVKVGEDDDYEICDSEFRFWSTDIKDIYKFVTTCFNAGYEQNSTCGNHVHLKLRDDIVGVVTYRLFYDKFIALYKSHFAGKKRYLNRLDNSYSRAFYDNHNAIQQCSGLGNRYSAVNIQALYSHGTIEIRILPYASNANELCESVRWLYLTVNYIIRNILGKVSNIESFNERLRYDTIEPLLIDNIIRVDKLNNYRLVVNNERWV